MENIFRMLGNAKGLPCFFKVLLTSSTVISPDCQTNCMISNSRSVRVFDFLLPIQIVLLMDVILEFPGATSRVPYSRQTFS
jgi:hypothetical protein